jgi:hypothetical protein
LSQIACEFAFSYGQGNRVVEIMKGVVDKYIQDKCDATTVTGSSGYDASSK